MASDRSLAQFYVLSQVLSQEYGVWQRAPTPPIQAAPSLGQLSHIENFGFDNDSIVNGGNAETFHSDMSSLMIPVPMQFNSDRPSGAHA